MTRIIALSDAHLLIQAEWTNKEIEKASEAEEVLEDFSEAVKKVEQIDPDAVFLAGDVFDYKTKGGRKVAHREGEKYMIEIRDVLENLADTCDCKIYAIKGNHDSIPVLRSVEKTLRGKFVFLDDKLVEIYGFKVFFMSTRYERGDYDLKGFEPTDADILVMHEQLPVYGMPGLYFDTLCKLSKKYKLIINGHMHFFKKGFLGFPNLIQLPAFIPSREIKDSWMYKYTWSYKSDELTVKERSSPFGFVIIDDLNRVSFEPYTPKRKIVHVEILGRKPEEYLKGLRMIYDILMERSDCKDLRIWIKVNANKITIDRLLWPEVGKYKDLCTRDILSLSVPEKETFSDITPREVSFEGKAFKLSQLEESILSSLSGREKEIAITLFENIFIPERLRQKHFNRLSLFIESMRIASRDFQVSDAFYERVRRLASRRS